MMKFAFSIAACFFVLASALAQEEELVPANKLMDKYLSKAMQEKKFLIAHFGSEMGQSAAGTSPSAMFNQTIEKWLSRGNRRNTFLFCFVSRDRNDGFEECYLNNLKVLGKEKFENVTPGIFLFSPEGKALAYETGDAWGDDTEANILKFLDSFTSKAASSRK